MNRQEQNKSNPTPNPFAQAAEKQKGMPIPPEARKQSQSVEQDDEAPQRPSKGTGTR